MGTTYPRVIDLLRREFEENKVTKYLFCKQTGINPTSVERYLCGISEPTQVSLEKLSAYFKVSVAWLRGDSFWTYEEERKIWDWNLLSDEEKDRINAAEIEKNNAEIQRLTGEQVELQRQIVENKSTIDKIRSDAEKYRELLVAFIHVPPEDRDDAIQFLQFIQKSNLPESETKKPE